MYEKYPKKEIFILLIACLFVFAHVFVCTSLGWFTSMTIILIQGYFLVIWSWTIWTWHLFYLFLVCYKNEFSIAANYSLFIIREVLFFFVFTPSHCPKILDWYNFRLIEIASQNRKNKEVASNKTSESNFMDIAFTISTTKASRINRNLNLPSFKYFSFPIFIFVLQTNNINFMLFFFFRWSFFAFIFSCSYFGSIF